MTSSREWQRARNPHQKARRREEILAAAKRLFAKGSYDEVSLNGIARESGMSKPNIYRYFSSREEIFLHIFAEEQDRFFDRLTASLKELGPSPEVSDMVKVWVENSVESPDLMALLPTLGTSLEKNSSVDQLVLFKKQGFERMRRLASLLHQLHPRLSPECWGEICTATVGLLAGLWPLCRNRMSVVKALAHPEVNLKPWDFRQKATFALSALIRGA